MLVAPHWSRFVYGDEVDIKQKREDSPCFPSFVIGWYERVDAPRGYVLQHERDRIVHVYPEAAVWPREKEK